MHEDRSVLGMILCRIFLKGREKSAADSLDKEFQFLLTGKEEVRHDTAGSEASQMKEGSSLLAKNFGAFK